MKDLYVFLVPSLKDTEVTTWNFKIATVAITCILYSLLFFVVSLVSFTTERFRVLSGVDKFTWCAKGTKVFYFPIPVFTGFWFLLVDDTLKDDVVNGTTITSFIAIYIQVGFFLLDSILMAVGKILYGRRFSTALLIHHLIVFTVYSIGICYNGKGHYFAILVFILDMAGPLSYINWMLAKAKLTHLFIWKVNQHISVYLWHFRTVLDLYYNYVLLKNWNYAWNEMPLPLLVTSSCGVLFVAFTLTPYWTYIEAKRLYRQHSHRTFFSNPIMNEKKEK